MESIKYAYQPSAKKVVHISDAQPGVVFLYVCGCCGNWLIPVQGEQREWHYRHKVDTRCDGAPMTMVHRMAQQILLESRRVIGPGRIGYLTYTAAVREAPVGPYRADTELEIAGEKAYIEIFVTSACGKEKIRHYKAAKLKSFVIDLSDVDPCIEPAELKRLVLEELQNRKELYWLEETKVSPRAKLQEWSGETLVLIIGLIVIVVGFAFWLLKRAKTRKRRFAAYS